MSENKVSSPRISVVMPCYNEESYIEKAIESLIDAYFLYNCELIVADGMSQDKTRQIIHSFIAKGFPIRILDNEMRYQSSGLNLAIAEARGEMIVRVDAHCVYPPGYVKKCTDLLERTGAANAGGIMLPRGVQTTQKAIALAMQHPMGVGDAKFHLGNFSGYVDTVYLGTFWKTVFDEIGLFNTRSQTNQDAELNLRILKAGKKIYLDSAIQVTYFPRESLKKLAVQYFKYGRGRCYTTLKHRRITSLRQIGPILLVIIFLFCMILSFKEPLFLGIPLFYFFVLILTALLSWRRQTVPVKQRFLAGIAFFLMHTSWGIGFLSYLLFRKNLSSKRVITGNK